jgi:hypothetical protein
MMAVTTVSLVIFLVVMRLLQDHLSGSPTAPSYLPALQPYWGSNRPFFEHNIAGTQPVDPPVYPTDVNSVFYEERWKFISG